MRVWEPWNPRADRADRVTKDYDALIKRSARPHGGRGLGSTTFMRLVFNVIITWNLDLLIGTG